MTLHTSPEPRLSALNKAAILRQHELFRELDQDSLDQIAAYAKAREVRSGATIFSKGDPGFCLFAVVRGKVLVTTSSSEGKSAVLNQFEKGDIFGEIALLDGMALQVQRAQQPVRQCPRAHRSGCRQPCRTPHPTRSCSPATRASG